MKLTLGRVLGIEIGVHYSAALLAAWVLVALEARFELVYPDWNAPALWAGAALGGVLFFAALIVHELAHAAVANARGLPARSITVFALGGRAQMVREPNTPASEFLIAIAGPAASLMTAAALLAIAGAFGWRPGTAPAAPSVAVPVWIGYINLLLAAVNLLPAYPLDGGRALHAALWRLTGNRDRSLRLSTRLASLLGLALIGLAALRLWTSGNLSAVWTALAGWFVIDIAMSAGAQARLAEALRRVSVGQVMTRNCAAVDHRDNLAEIMSHHVPQNSSAFCLLVVEDARMAGVITAQELHDIPEPQWRYRTAGDVMRRLEEGHTINPETPVLEAVERMGREHVSQLAVGRNGTLEGVISRAAVANWIVERR